MKQLIPIEQNNQRVLLTNQIAELYGTTDRRISENFNANKERYQEEKHFYCLEGETLKQFKDYYGNSVSVGERTSKLYLWTEKGALLHAKSLNTDKAWQMYDVLVDTYFNAKRQIPRQMSQAEILAGLAQVNVELYKELEDVAHCCISARQSRLRNRMEKAWATYKERQAISKIDVISRDPKLRSIFEGIVKQHQARFEMQG